MAITQVNPRDRTDKETLVNLRATGECVVNIVSEDQAEIMNASCANYPSDVIEFSTLGIASSASHCISVAGVKAAKVRFECRLREELSISSLPMGRRMMLLDVVSIFVDESVLIDDQVAPYLWNTIGNWAEIYIQKPMSDLKWLDRNLNRKNLNAD